MHLSAERKSLVIHNSIHHKQSFLQMNVNKYIRTKKTRKSVNSIPALDKMLRHSSAPVKMFRRKCQGYKKQWKVTCGLRGLCWDKPHLPLPCCQPHHCSYNREGGQWPLSHPLGCAAMDNQAHTAWSNVSPRNISRMVQGSSRSKTPSKGDFHKEQINTSEIQPHLLTTTFSASKQVSSHSSHWVTGEETS